MNRVAVMVTARARKNPPVTPVRKARGMNTTMVLIDDPIRGRAISAAAPRGSAGASARRAS